MIMYDSDEAAQIRTVRGWVSSDGKFWGDNEHLARFSGSTHEKCETEGCENLVEKRLFYTVCDECRDAAKVKKFDSYPTVPWDGETPLMLYDSDIFFFDSDSILYFCEENEMDPVELKVLLCNPVPYPRFDIDNFLAGVMSEDGDIPEEVIDAADKLNSALSKMEPQLWESTDVAVILSL